MVLTETAKLLLVGTSYKPKLQDGYFLFYQLGLQPHLLYRFLETFYLLARKSEWNHMILCASSLSFKFRNYLKFVIFFCHQDTQFKIGESSKMSVAFWYPVDGNPWHGSGHYTIYCDWVPLEISSASNSMLTRSAQGNSGSAASVFALLLSVVSLCISAFVGYRVLRPKSVAFTPMGENENL